MLKTDATVMRDFRGILGCQEKSRAQEHLYTNGQDFIVGGVYIADVCMIN